MATNRFGLDAHYFKEKLGLLVRDCDNYTPAEMARSLERLRDVALPDAPNGRCDCGRPCAVFGAKQCPECHRQEPEYLEIPRFLRKQND